MIHDDLEDLEEGEYDPDPDCADEDPEGCCLGSACLNPHPYHLVYECFDLEMAEASMSDPEQDPRP